MQSHKVTKAQSFFLTKIKTPIILKEE